MELIIINMEHYKNHVRLPCSYSVEYNFKKSALVRLMFEESKTIYKILEANQILKNSLCLIKPGKLQMI